MPKQLSGTPDEKPPTHRSRSDPAISERWWKFSNPGGLEGPMMLSRAEACHRREQWSSL
jgi:hypothetical protein